MNQRILRLVVDDLTASGRFSLRLMDCQGRSVAFHQFRADPCDARCRGLFEMDAYLEIERGRGRTERELLAELGDFLRDEVLGPHITTELFKSQRTGILFVQLPKELRPEAVELARVPWELAHDAKGRSLPEAGLAVQVIPLFAMGDDALHDLAEDKLPPFDPQGPLRVLIALVQTRTQTALAMRHMRERLLEFFLRRLAPRYQVQVDVLQYGVTREVLGRAARRRGGYHIVHLFAHAHENVLLLEDNDGRDDPVSGEELSGLLSGDFADPPHLVFLTACHSGEIMGKASMAQLWQALRDLEPHRIGATPDAHPGARFDEVVKNTEEQHTGIALAMLRGGIRQVVAMRYAVEERFAFDLAETFYQYVLLDKMAPSMALARFRLEALCYGGKRGYRQQDWATPVFFGGPEGTQSICLSRGRSDAADRLWPRGRLPEGLRQAKLFVGRVDELRRLRLHVFSDSPDDAVVLLWGVAGLGKTALAGEVVHLWHSDFDCILGTTPLTPAQPISFDTWLQDVNYYVTTSLGEEGYRIWDERGDIDMARWLQDRLDELVRFLNSHRTLLVIDNFESNLRRHGEEGQTRYVCADPQWSAALERLARDLVPGLSCLVVTSRRFPAEFSAQDNVLSIAIGPLNFGEWWVFARSADGFRKLLWGDDATRGLLARALAVARGHPLILRALERLAADPAELTRCLDEFESYGERYAAMSNVLAMARSETQQAEEMAYFEDVVGRSVRALIESCSPAAQRLLRVVTLDMEPAFDDRIAFIWEDQNWGEKLPSLQPEGQGWQQPLHELLDAGLLTPVQMMGTRTDGLTQDSIFYVWHPIVTEQAAEILPRGDLFPEKEYLQRYAYRYLIVFTDWLKKPDSTKRKIAIEVARYAIRYLLRAGEVKMAKDLVRTIYSSSQTLDFRRELQSWIEELLDLVQLGKDRDDLLECMIHVCLVERQPQAAISLCRKILEAAKVRHDWRACASLSHKLGVAHAMADDYRSARDAYKAALQYNRQAGVKDPSRLLTLVELVRLMVFEYGKENMGRRRERAARLVRIARAGYERCQTDPAISQTLSADQFANVLFHSLDLQRMIETTEAKWSDVLHLCEEQIQLARCHHKDESDLARAIFNRAMSLVYQGRGGDVKGDLRFCQEVFIKFQQPLGHAHVLSLFAEIASQDGDPERALQFETQAMKIRQSAVYLTEIAISHSSLGKYQREAGRWESAILETCCAFLAHCAVGREMKVSNWMESFLGEPPQITIADVLDHWPAAADIFGAYPQLGELLGQRGITVESAQEILDHLRKSLVKEGE